MSLQQHQNSAGSPVSAQLAAMLVAAVVLGAAFNSANPLGVRTASGPAKERAVAVVAAPSLYENETAGMSLESEGPTPLRAAAAPMAAPAAEPPVVPVVDSLTWPQTKKLLDAGKILLVDARDAVYFQTGHIPGAISLPAASSSSEILAFAGKYPKDTAIIVYCGSAQCPLANALVKVLKDQLAFSNVREMPGGFVEFRQAEAQGAKGGGP